MAQVIAILETMYDWRGMTTGAGYESVQAPRWFSINPRNHSGKRLYRLIGEGHSLLVTNACRELGRTANCHGKPNPDWLFENLMLLREDPGFNLILVCGRVAQETYRACGFTLPAGAAHLEIPHPAARMWTKALIEQTTRKIASLLRPPVPAAADVEDYTPAA